jgi:quinol monooxygenase YgiN
MSKVAVIAKITALPDKRDEVVAILSGMVKKVEDEPGTLVYSLNTDKGDPDVIWFYELYTDDAALGTHGGSDAMKEMGQQLRGLAAGRPELFVLDLVAAKGLPS